MRARLLLRIGDIARDRGGGGSSSERSVYLGVPGEFSHLELRELSLPSLLWPMLARRFNIFSNKSAGIAWRTLCSTRSQKETVAKKKARGHEIPRKCPRSARERRATQSKLGTRWEQAADPRTAGCLGASVRGNDGLKAPNIAGSPLAPVFRYSLPTPAKSQVASHRSVATTLRKVIGSDR